MASTDTTRRRVPSQVTLEPGYRSGRLVVICHIEERHGGNYRLVRCRCDCGVCVDVPASYMVSGKRRSCGCGKRQAKTHGQTCRGKWTRAYKAWSNMITRCVASNEDRPDFVLYKARGITVCDRWMSFNLFFEDMGECPDGLTLDRINNDGNYEPGNCRWTDVKTQQRNKRTNRIVTWQGETMTLADLADKTGINARCLWHRMTAYGWTVDRAATTPVGPAHNTRKRKDVQGIVA